MFGRLESVICLWAASLINNDSFKINAWGPSPPIRRRQHSKAGRHYLPHFMTAASSTEGLTHRHYVDGLECVEVSIDIAEIGPIIILEATAASQETLVNLALSEDQQLVSMDLNAGDPYGAVLWPAASALANYLMTNLTTTLHGLSILEVGAGTGLVSLAASRGGADRVLATDYETIPLRLLEHAHYHLNAHHDNDRPACTLETQLFDLCNESMPLPDADLVVAADIMYEPRTGRAMARRVYEALQRGSRVLVGDSPGRAGRPAFLEELRRLGVVGVTFVDTVGRTCSGPRHDLICGKGSTSVSDTPQELAVAIMHLVPPHTPTHKTIGDPLPS